MTGTIAVVIIVGGNGAVPLRKPGRTVDDHCKKHTVKLSSFI
jgi:hypothetical protein